MERKPFLKAIADLPVEDAHDGAGRRQLILSANDAVSSRFEALTKGILEPGHAFDWHDHLGVDEFFIVLAGQGSVSFKDGTLFFYKSGDVVYMPSDIAHKIEAQGDEPSVFFFVRVAA